MAKYCMQKRRFLWRFFYFYTKIVTMKTLINLFFTTIFVLLLANFLPGVRVNSFATALLVAAVLGLLNIFVKPILILFTLPATIFTLGLFLLVINAIIVMLCAELVKGFTLDSFWAALLFSLVLSFCQSLVAGVSADKDRR
jgi:putative membrane protein